MLQYTAYFDELADPSGFEPEPGAPEAPIISKLYYGSIELYEVFGREEVWPADDTGDPGSPRLRGWGPNEDSFLTLS